MVLLLLLLGQAPKVPARHPARGKAPAVEKVKINHGLSLTNTHGT